MKAFSLFDACNIIICRYVLSFFNLSSTFHRFLFVLFCDGDGASTTLSSKYLFFFVGDDDDDDDDDDGGGGCITRGRSLRFAVSSVSASIDIIL